MADNKITEALMKKNSIIDLENYLKPIIDNIDEIEGVRKVVKEISLELSGES
jgi:hypothetical protein